jgi:hypothetical protein
VTEFIGDNAAAALESFQQEVAAGRADNRFDDDPVDDLLADRAGDDSLQ